MTERLEEQGGEDGPLAEVVEGEGEKRKITAKAIKARLKEIGKDTAFDEERQALEAFDDLLKQEGNAKKERKEAQEALDTKIDTKYPALAEAEIKTLVIDDKWLAILAASVQGEIDHVSQHLTGRIRQLAERYDTPLPQLISRVAELSVKVDGHLSRMGALWS